MAKKSKPDVEFSVPDDVFDEESENVIEEQSPDEDPPKPVKFDDEPAEPKKAKAVEPEPEEVEEEEAPPVTPPMDLGYVLAEERRQVAELAARLAFQEEQRRKESEPADKEAEEEKRLFERRAAARQKATTALREGDEVSRMEAQWELNDIDQEMFRRDSAKNMRAMRGERPDAPQQGRPPGISREQAIEIESQTFCSTHRVTPEEQIAMDREWQRFIAKNPAWNAPTVRRWSALEKALKLVRKTPTLSPGGGTSLVEGGQHSAPSKSGKVSKQFNGNSLARAAASFEMSVDDFKKMIDKRSR